MSDKNGYNHRHSHRHCKHKGGPGSFWMHDPEVVFRELNLKDGDRFLDMGCGPGDYAVRASQIVGNPGVVYALDIWEKMIDDLKTKADSQGFKNIKAMVADITDPLPIEDSCIDVCFIATVLHIPDLARVWRSLFTEIRRVLKPGGRIAIIECKMEAQPLGPPIHMRLSPEEVEDLITQYGFEKVGLADLGYNYMIQFAVK